MIIINIGMPRSGTLWRYNILRELIVSNGGVDGLEIRNKYKLHYFLGKNNSDVNNLKPERFFPILVPSILGDIFVVNTHAKPRPTTKLLIRLGMVKAVYGYRDPRACILSMMEYSQRALPSYSANFLENKSVEQFVKYMDLYHKVWEGWMGVESALIIKYEDMLIDYYSEVERITNYLGIDTGNKKTAESIKKYIPRNKSEDGPHMHLEHGEAERFRERFSSEELSYINQEFGPYLHKMGYRL